MNMLQKSKSAIILCVLSIFLCCTSEDSNQNFEIEKAIVSVKLTAKGQNYEAVNVEVLDIHLLVIDDKSAPNCWLSLNAVNRGVYNLLDLKEGFEANLVNGLKIPVGDIYEIKLVLGDNNSIAIDGETLPLVMNSVHQSGLEVRMEHHLNSNASYSILLDFDVEHSIEETYIENRIILKPVLGARLMASTEAL